MTLEVTGLFLVDVSKPFLGVVSVDLVCMDMLDITSRRCLIACRLLRMAIWILLFRNICRKPCFPCFAAGKLNTEVEAQRYFRLRHPSENLIYGAQIESSKKMACRTRSCSDPHKLRVRSGGHYRSRLIIDNLPYRGCGKGQRAANLASPALDLNNITILGGTLIRDMDVCAYSGLAPVVPCSDSDATNPVNERC